MYSSVNWGNAKRGNKVYTLILRTALYFSATPDCVNPHCDYLNVSNRQWGDTHYRGGQEDGIEAGMEGCRERREGRGERE